MWEFCSITPDNISEASNENAQIQQCLAQCIVKMISVFSLFIADIAVTTW